MSDKTTPPGDQLVAYIAQCVPGMHDLSAYRAGLERALDAETCFVFPSAIYRRCLSIANAEIARRILL